MGITCTDLGFENDWLVLDLVGGKALATMTALLT